MMPLSSMCMAGISSVTTIDEVFNFQDSVYRYRTMSAVRNYTLFETLLLANSPFNLLVSNKRLNILIF